MAVTSIGNRIIKEIGTGKELKKVITQRLDGIDYLNIFDSEGKNILSRAKKITREVVGNKKVNTVTKVTSSPAYPVSSPLAKTTYNRVYNNDGQLLGTRYIKEVMNYDESNGFVKDMVAKQTATDNFREIKFYKEGRLDTKALVTSPLGGIGSPYKDSYAMTAASINYNKKGLPCPQGMSGDNSFSLQEMVNMHLKASSHIPYAHPALKLGHLDKSTSHGTINKLDQYI